LANPAAQKSSISSQHIDSTRDFIAASIL